MGEEQPLTFDSQKTLFSPPFMLLLHFLVILFSQSEAKASISRVCRAGLLAG